LTEDLVLRDVVTDDLPMLFEQQLDPAANYMAAFTSKDPTDRNAFLAHWAKILADKTVVMKTIIVKGKIIGSVGSFHMFGQHQVTYWIGKDYWGKGFASRALSKFLQEVVTGRPIYARAAKDNAASIRVMEKCGFTFVGYAKSFASARGKKIDEIIMKLEVGTKHNV
jgi:RimJ/RimL family protein N-acetyltransferase